jgi:hypothetical protein
VKINLVPKVKHSSSTNGGCVVTSDLTGHWHDHRGGCVANFLNNLLCFVFCF